MVPDRQETGEASTMVVSAYSLERISRQWYREGYPHCVWQLPLVKRHSLEFRDAHVDGVCEAEYERGDSCSERTRTEDLQKVPLYVAEYWSTCMKGGRELTEGRRNTKLADKTILRFTED